ncbi:hypothetical protein CAEBREN_04650 [Caenorhabditis brenneri]|uniref:Uncharacterized protein n=1 Tax=Caenorhabditis brenneri TaxID=135651 RepID=G0NW66_CAEBE|nr:hypothetical protein CAEBREN_04650 [Caenorhabditis brenneri]
MHDTGDAETTVILDNGGHNIKLGVVGAEGPRLIPNSIVKAKHEKKRVFVGHEQADCSEKFSLFYVRPIERGYVVNWDTQEQIWEKSFSKFDIEPTTSRIAYTDNNYLIPALPDVSNEIFFDKFGFQEVHKASASGFVADHAYKIRRERCACVVDSGFSWTTIACFVDGVLIQESVIRIDVGGKALTNKLKDWISYRQLNVSEETHVINECKEDVCFVAMDFEKSMIEAKKRFDENMIEKRYIMPDFQTSFRGQVKGIREPLASDAPSIVLGVERFAIPEILFNPSDIDIDQCGVAEAVVESITQSPEDLRAALSENIIVIGGSSCFPGYRDRLLQDVRSMLPAEFDVKVSENVANPETHAWQCAEKLLEYPAQVAWINRKEWDERGDSLEYSRFFRTTVTSDELKATTQEFEQKGEKSPKNGEEEEF